MKNKSLATLTFFILLFPFLTNCSSTNSEGTALVTINLNLTNANAGSKNLSLIDRFLRFFATEAKAAAPANITSLTLKISAPDMAAMTTQYASSTTSIEVEVPAGNKRVFELTALSNTYYYTGTSTVNLNAGEDKAITIDMGIEYSTVNLTASFATSTPANITSYSVTVSVTNASTTTTFLSAQPFTPGTAVNIPTGTNRDIMITAYAPSGDYSGSLVTQTIAAGSGALTVTMANEYTNVAIQMNFPMIASTSTPAANMIGTYTMSVMSGTSTVFGPATFASGTAIQIPSGSNKDFIVTANTTSVTFRGSSTGQTLTANSTTTMPVSLSLYETKIVIPDNQNYRVVQLNDMTGLGWKTVTSTIVGWVTGTDLLPYDVDYDSLGRIYIANNFGSTGKGVVIRMNNINGGNILLIADNGSGYASIAVDRTNNILYKATSGGTLSRCSLDGTGNVTLTGGPIFNAINGLAVDDTGMLYISYMVSTTKYVGKFTPATSTIALSGTAYTIATGTPWGIRFQSPNIYVANLAGSVNNNIIQFDTSLTRLSGFGTNVSTGTSTGQFYGPRKFVAIRAKELIIVDDDETFGVNADKLVSIDDILGTNWTTYGSSGNATGSFAFYNQC